MPCWDSQRLFSLGMIMELCLSLSFVCWSKYLGMDAAKLNIKPWLSLVAQVAWWVKDCMIGASTRIGQVPRFPLTTSSDQTTSCLLTKWLHCNWIELQIRLNLVLTMVLRHTLILISRLASLYRIEFWSRPTLMQFFKLLTCKISKWLWFL